MKNIIDKIINLILLLLIFLIVVILVYEYKVIFSKDDNKIVSEISAKVLESTIKPEPTKTQERLKQTQNTISATTIPTEKPIVVSLQGLLDEQKTPTTTNNYSQKSDEKLELYTYYSQLDEYGKMIYDGMKDNMEKLQTGTFVIDFSTKFNKLLNSNGGKETLNRAYQSSIAAFLLDNPSVFYIETSNMYMIIQPTTTYKETTYRVKIGPREGENYLSDGMTYTDVVRKSKELEKIKTDITNAIGIKETTYNKIIKIHDYLVDNVEYDTTRSKEDTYNIYGALVNKECVCAGYADAYKYLLDELDVPCVIIYGMATNSDGTTEGHGWNYVKIDDKWYAVDCTWDDPVVIGEGRVDSKTKYNYFLKGEIDFFENHTESANIATESQEFIYPKLNKEDYKK